MFDRFRFSLFVEKSGWSLSWTTRRCWLRSSMLQSVGKTAASKPGAEGSGYMETKSVSAMVGSRNRCASGVKTKEGNGGGKGDKYDFRIRWTNTLVSETPMEWEIKISFGTVIMLGV